MSYRLRKLVFWLLLIALPLQGFAAVTGAACTCMHARMMMEVSPTATTARAQAVDAPRAHDAGQDGDTPCHTPPLMDESHCAAHADNGAPDKSDPSGTSCQACSGCCIVYAALPVVAIVAQDTHLPRTVAASLPDLFKDYVAATPKRPPRFLSA